MSSAADKHAYRVPILPAQRRGRALIAQPNEDVRDLLAEHCHRFGLDPLVEHPDVEGELPDVDVIILEPASIEGKRLLELHAARASSIPLVFVSVYPPISVASSPAVAYLVLPCSRERFEAALAKAF